MNDNTSTTIADRIKGLFKKQPTEIKTNGQVTLATANEVSTWNSLLQRGEAQHQEVSKKYRTIYRSGGIVRAAIDAYILFIFSGGWQMASDDEHRDTQQLIQDNFFSKTGAFNITIQQMTQDAICIGDGYAKILTGAGQLTRTPVALQHIPAERVKPHIDNTYSILWYDVYNKDGSAILERIKPEDMLHVCLQPSGGEIFGVGLLESAWDEIRHDIEVAEGSAAAIRRHGFGIWHAKVSSTDPETTITEKDVDAVRQNMKSLSSRTEIVTSSNVEISALNEAGQINVGAYADWSIARLCTALGMPGELLGLRQGTTDATAVSRIENFYKKIQTYQELLAQAINTQYIDRILSSTGKVPGSVWIEYADPSPEDNIKRASYVSSIAAITPGDPFGIMSQQQIQTYLGIDHDQWAKDEEFLESETNDAAMAALENLTSKDVSSQTEDKADAREENQ